MKLYYMPGACSLATHIVLEWVDASYETHKLSHDELKQDAYLRINPAGAVPALDVDGWVLTQNAAVLNYLVEKYPDAKLNGDGSLEARTEINRWFGFTNSDLHPKFKPLFGATGYLDDAAIDKTKAHAKKVIRPLLERVNDQLEGKDWIVESRSVVDPYVYVMLRWAKMMEIDLSGLSNLDNFLQRMDDDAGVREALEAEGLA